jgi:uncharacterized protein YndB with AHSA1/START domain
MTSTVEHATFVIERPYAASPARVFAAFADPAQKFRWFGDDDIEKGAEHTLDFRIGGKESMRGNLPDGGTTFTYDALYQDIVNDERIVYSYEMTMNDRRISVSVATLEFRSKPGGGTRFILTEQGAYLDGLDTSAAREEGTLALLELLAGFLGEVTA